MTTARVSVSTPLNPARYRRRKIGSAVMEALCVAAAAIGLVVLTVILLMLVQKGVSGLSLSVFTEPMRTPGGNGGFSNAIVGTLLQTGLGIAIGAPLGVAAGVYLSEFGQSRVASVVRFVNDILLSAPSVLIGLFVYQIIVLPMGGFSGFAGAVALALIAMPVVARTTEDILKLVPDDYRLGSLALGARQSTTVIKVILPAAFSGILTGILLAVARISGETAPLIFTSLGSFNLTADMTQPMASLPIAIYRYAASPYPEWVSLAWTGAFIITVGVLVLNIASRMAHSLISKR